MSNSNGIVGFIAGTIVGAAVGVVAGLLMAPRSGAETRTMAADVATDAWGNVVEACHHGQDAVASQVETTVGEVKSETATKADELREKVDQARARMDQIRASLVHDGDAETAGAASAQDDTPAAASAAAPATL